MTRICPACGTDAMFDVARCPSCGASMTGASSGARPSEPGAGAGPWEKTVVEPRPPVVREEGRRARFDRGREFYEPIDDRNPQPDRTSAGTGDETVVERHEPIPHDDETVIVRAGRKGVEGPLAYLIERNGIRAGKVHLLARTTAIGRGSDNNVVLGDETVSKHHAKVRLEDGGFVYWDLASTNFSHVIGPDGSRSRILEPHRLSDGDTVELGDARLTFILVANDGMAGDAS
jgi:FHA domain